VIFGKNGILKFLGTEKIIDKKGQTVKIRQGRVC